jgi:3-oxoacyl-[acyl-carrier protein] reductase
LTARAALVTGGSRGIGLALARALLGAGHAVAITAARDAAALTAATDALRARFGGDRVLGLLADAADADAAARAVAETAARFGRLEILVNNAGRGPGELNAAFHVAPRPFWELDPPAWREVVRTNVDGPFLMARAAAPHMLRAGWGRIVNVSTSRATMIKRGFAPYGPSKAALDTMTRLFADDLRGTGVTVNALAPGGPTETAFIPEGAREGAYADLLPPTVMDAPLLWLCSAEADGVTAARLVARHWDPADPDAAREDAGEAPRIL